MKAIVHTKTGFPGPVRDCSGIGELVNRAGLEHYVLPLSVHCASKTHCVEEAGPCQQTDAQSGCQASLSKNCVLQVIVTHDIHYVKVSTSTYGKAYLVVYMLHAFC